MRRTLIKMILNRVKSLMETKNHEIFTETLEEKESTHNYKYIWPHYKIQMKSIEWKQFSLSFSLDDNNRRLPCNVIRLSKCIYKIHFRTLIEFNFRQIKDLMNTAIWQCENLIFSVSGYPRIGWCDFNTLFVMKLWHSIRLKCNQHFEKC